jgi:hypothetical protein
LLYSDPTDNNIDDRGCFTCLYWTGIVPLTAPVVRPLPFLTMTARKLIPTPADIWASRLEIGGVARPLYNVWCVGPNNVIMGQAVNIGVNQILRTRSLIQGETYYFFADINWGVGRAQLHVRYSC